MSSTVEVQSYTAQDLEAVIDVFQRAVHAIPDRVYTPEQKAAWAPHNPDIVAWQARLANSTVFVACSEGQICGFMDVTKEGLIDLAFVAPEAQGKGVGKLLLNQCEKYAQSFGLQLLKTKASLSARRFFSPNGFELVAENTVARRGQLLINFSMQKKIRPKIANHRS